MIIDWAKIALQINDTIKQKILKLKIKPNLLVILVWNNSSSIRYIKQKQKIANYVWIQFNLKKFDENVTQEILLKYIKQINEDKNIDWYIVQLPLPKHINEKNIINSIDPKKDIDWFHPINQWKILIWDDSWLIPCTPAWIIEILNYEKVNLSWKIITVIWKSNIVWKPIIALLINKWATVLSCNSKTKNIKNFTKQSDIVISATWNPWLLKENMLKKLSLIIDVWFTVIDNKIHWDAETKNIDNKWHKITPVPWWVWCLTVTMLMKNILKTFCKNKKLT